MPVQFPFDNTYARLPDRFFARVQPTPVPAPRLIRVNHPLAIDLGLNPEALESEEGAQIFAGNRIPENAEPIAMAYAGHQFGGLVPQLGDGRAILLGEVVDRNGVRRDIQLKGPGRTPFSRGGDGRAALGPVLREYVVSEAMHALGIPTTRGLAAVTTGGEVAREEMLPGAIFTRVASGHIRVGTFQYFAIRGDVEGTRTLADYVIARHYPHCVESNKPYRALLDAVIDAQAQLIARWMMVGFIHGVMNTDNMSVAGETIDYGPCAFMDVYNPATVYSSIDRWGRYAYINQPDIAQWNLTRMAECLLPLLNESQEAAVADATEALQAFAPKFGAAYDDGLRRKLGLASWSDDDVALSRDLLTIMTDNGADFTLTFRYLGEAALGRENDTAMRELFIDTAAIDQWLSRWRQRLAADGRTPASVRQQMRQANPAFIPRNHRVEAVIRAAVDKDDFAPFHQLVEILARPFDDQPEFAQFMQPPQEHERVLQTFCGT
jgi:serine/tyrosine/threonine adenylyltransferase